MALKKCKECGHEVSTKADKCPNCGAPQKRRPLGCAVLIVILLLGVFIAVEMMEYGNHSTQKSSRNEQKSITKSTEPVSTPPAEPVTTPPAETGSAAPAETVSTPPAETVSTPPAETGSAPPAETVSTKPKKSVNENNKNNYIEILKIEIDRLDNYDVNMFMGSVPEILLGAEWFAEGARIAEDGEKFILEKEELELLAKYKHKLSLVQYKSLPKLRDAFGPALRKKLWELDTSAKTFGGGFRTIEFVGYYFSANINIKEFHITMRDILRKLRFTQARYKWYKGAEEYTYFEMKAPSDRDLAVWEEDGSYRIIK